MKKMLSLFLALILVFSLSFSIAEARSSQPTKILQNSENTAIAKLATASNDSFSRLYFKFLFGSDSFYRNQWQTIKSVTKLNDDIYTLNYTYDYDIDDLLNRGVDSIGDFLLYCSNHLLFGKLDFKLKLDGFGCTMFSCFNEEGDHLTGRNFDYKDSSCFVVWTDPEDGYASVSMVDSNMILFSDINKPSSPLNSFQVLLAPYLPLDGINEKGLSMGVLQVSADKADQDTGKTDIITTVAIRAVLDKCSDVHEAIELLSDYDMHDMLNNCCYHYLLSDANGESCVIEYINNEMRVLWADEESKTQAVTNFFLSPDGVANKSSGQERFERVTECLSEHQGTLSETDCMKLLNSVHKNYRPRNFPWYVTTLWSAVYNADDLTMNLCVRMNYDTIFQFSPVNLSTVSVLSDNANISTYSPPKD